MGQYPAKRTSLVPARVNPREKVREFMGKKDNEIIAQMEDLIKKFEEFHSEGIQIKESIEEILKSGWEDGSPILEKRRKELERSLRDLDALVGDDDLPGENENLQ
jgi:hypothetical protein